MTKKRELELTGPVKALAMLVIVLYHACAIYGGVWFGEPATPCPALGVFVQWLSTMHVPLFLLVSGYIWAYIKMETDKYDDACVVLKKKAKRLLVPYLFVGVVWAGPVYCFFYGPVSTVESFALGNNPSQLWFLLALFWMFVFVELMWRIGPALLCKWLTLLASAIVAYIFARAVYTLPLDLFQVARGFDYFPCFLLGALLRQTDTSRFWRIKPAALFATDVALFVAWYVCSASGGALGAASKVLLFILRLVGPLLLLSIFGHAEWLIDKVHGSLFEKHSFGVYLFHQQVDWILLSLINVPGVPPMAIVVTLFFISLTVSLGISIVLKRWKVTAKLL